MSEANELRDQLAAPFPASTIKFFPKAVKADGDKPAALAAAYADVRAYEDHLDAVVGPAGWSTRYRIIDPAAKAVECQLSVRYGDEWIVKSDVGYPNDARDADDAAQEPLKAAYSEALKRACSQHGVGRFIYGIELAKAWWLIEVSEYQGKKRFKAWIEQPRLKGEQAPQRPVAQPVEHPAHNGAVAGPSPAGPTSLSLEDFYAVAMQRLGLRQGQALTACRNKTGRQPKDLTAAERDQLITDLIREKQGAVPL